MGASGSGFQNGGRLSYSPAAGFDFDYFGGEDAVAVV
jgi:hypothetical protein